MAGEHQQDMSSAQLAYDSGDERIDVIADINSLIVWRAAPDGTPLQACGVSDVLPEDAGHHSETWLEAVHPDDREKVRPVWRKAIGSGSVFHAFYRLRQPDGSFRWSRGCGVPLLDQNGSIREWIGTIADIDDEIRARETLERSEERLRLAVESTGIGIWDLDMSTGEIWCSDTTARILGRPPGRPLSDAEAWSLIHPDDRALLGECVDAAFSGAGNGRFGGEFRVLDAGTGDAVRIACSARILYDAGRPARVLGTIRDIDPGREQQQSPREFAPLDRPSGLAQDAPAASRG